jgi:hypothetical protein
MRLAFVGLVLVSSSIACMAQEWEIGAGGGYGWPLNSSVTPAGIPVRSGQAPRAAFSIFSAENPYNYLGGEFQYAFRQGGTEIKSNGFTETASGYSNILVYNLTVHMTPFQSKIRPFVAAGTGIKIYTNTDFCRPFVAAGTGINIYTNTDFCVPQPLAGVVLLRRGTQVEPVVSFNGGVKYMLPHHVQLRLDLRVYTSPAPDELIRPIAPARIRGWIYDLMPMAGIAYMFGER